MQLNKVRLLATALQLFQTANFCLEQKVSGILVNQRKFQSLAVTYINKKSKKRIITA